MAELRPETYADGAEGMRRSAAAVLPVVFDYLGTPTYLLDVGGGERHWCKAAETLGVEESINADLLGFGDYEWNAETGLPLPLPKDVFPLWQSDARWQLVLCLEMAEHVSPAAGDHLVAELTRVADAVLWSAAIPGQGGDGHVNEQWPDYWHARFQQHGWSLTDPFRDGLWGDADVEPWYRQNTLLALRDIEYTSRPWVPRALVDPVTWAHHRGVPAPGVV